VSQYVITRWQQFNILFSGLMANAINSLLCNSHIALNSQRKNMLKETKTVWNFATPSRTFLAHCRGIGREEGSQPDNLQIRPCLLFTIRRKKNVQFSWVVLKQCSMINYMPSIQFCFKTFFPFEKLCDDRDFMQISN